MKIKKKLKKPWVRLGSSPGKLNTVTGELARIDGTDQRNLQLLQSEFMRLTHAVDDVKRYGVSGTHEVCARMLRSTYELIDLLKLEVPVARRPKARR